MRCEKDIGRRIEAIGNKQRNRQKDTNTNRQKDCTNRQKDTHMNRQQDTNTNRQTHKQSGDSCGKRRDWWPKS